MFCSIRRGPQADKQREEQKQMMLQQQQLLEELMQQQRKLREEASNYAKEVCTRAWVRGSGLAVPNRA